MRLNNSRPAKPRGSRDSAWSTRAGWDAQADTLDTTFFKMMKLEVGQGDMKASYSGRKEDLKRALRNDPEAWL